MSSRRFAISCLEPEIVCELSRAISAQKNCQPRQSDDGAQMSLIDHGTLCELYNEVWHGRMDKINELPEPDELPPADEDSTEYKAGFQAGKEGKPSDGKTVDWHRGWADAQE
jgi:hypothetical protein